MTTEHFVMQGAIGAAVNEQQARASMYLISVSGALVAVGLVSQSNYFLIFVATVLPMLSLDRLVDHSTIGRHLDGKLAIIRDGRANSRIL